MLKVDMEWMIDYRAYGIDIQYQFEGMTYNHEVPILFCPERDTEEQLKGLFDAIHRLQQAAIKHQASKYEEDNNNG